MVNQLNMLHAAINEEIMDVRDKNVNDEVNAARANYVYGDGSVVFPMDSLDDVVPIGDGSYDYEDCGHINDLLGESHSLIRDGDILKVPNANIQILAAYARMFASEENLGSFYGMVIVDGAKKVNPLHPVIASMIMTKEMHLSGTFTIIVYPYRAGGEHTPSMSRVDAFSSRLISMISTIREERYLPQISYACSESYRDTAQKALLNGLNHCPIPFREGGQEVRGAMIPVHLATRGIVYPYYGMIKSRKSPGSSYASGNLFPMLSGNIDTYSDSYGSTCVGDLSNYAFSSLYVLSNMNINSLYFYKVLTYEFRDFVCACQTVSAGFLGFAAGLEPVIKEEPEEESSDTMENEGDATENAETTMEEANE